MHVHWHEGLFLQPHHLQWMQRSLQSEIRATRSLLHPLGFGVVDSDLSMDALAQGRVLFNRLRVIMPRGEEVSFPDDAELPELDVRPALSKQSGAQDIFLIVPLWAGQRANAFDLGSSPDPKIKRLFIPREKRDIADENTGENRQTMHLRKINARLGLKGESFEDTDTLPLLRVLRPAGDNVQARLDPDYIPACIYLKSSRLLYTIVRDLMARVQTARDELQIKLSGGGFALEDKWTRMMKLTALNRICGIWPALIEEGSVPPLLVYTQLRELLGELAALIPNEDLFECRAYDHNDPLPGFKDLDQKIRRAILDDLDTRKRPLQVPFTEIKPGLCRTESLGDEHFDGPNDYLLAVRTPVPIPQLVPYVTDGNKFKLMPKSMELTAVFGIELQYVQVPPIQLPGGAHYFRFAPTSNQKRWDQIKTDRVASLVWNNQVLEMSKANGTTFTLWMTLP